MVKLLEGLLGVEVIAQAGDGEEALAQAVQCQPDLMLLDIAMPKLNGLQVCERLSHMQPATKVVMLSMHREQQYVRKALQSGASGYLLKDAAPAELGVALQAVQDGKIYLSPALSQDMVAGVVQGLRTPQAQPLTPRQTEVLTLAAMGKSTKEIALKLGLSIKTVDTHRTNLMNQLDIHDLAGLVRYAARQGLISVND
jgi:DNA-binding NarL/FixJ family response regulator